MTFIAIIFNVPLTQRTVLNIDLGADSCGVHILENGSIEPEEKDNNYLYAYGVKLWITCTNNKQDDPIHYPLTTGFIYNSEVSVKLANKDKCIYSILAKSTDVTSDINRSVKHYLSWIVNYICQFLSL